MKYLKVLRNAMPPPSNTHASFCMTPVKEKSTQRICMLLMLFAAISSTPAWGAPKKTQARYPSQLYGMWIPEWDTCPAVGQSYDGDMVMHIGPRLLQGYEDQSKPTSVALISRAPLAWRIEAMMDVGPSGFYVKDAPRIFVLGKERVTVATEDRADTYKRCARDKK
ncbi:MAG TPA: hypothetical protein VIT22_06475 [Pseudoxanthomonas sp.]